MNRCSFQFSDVTEPKEDFLTTLGMNKLIWAPALSNGTNAPCGKIISEFGAYKVETISCGRVGLKTSFASYSI